MNKIFIVYAIAIAAISFGIVSKNEFLFSREKLADHLAYPMGWETVKTTDKYYNFAHRNEEIKKTYKKAVLLWESSKKNTHANLAKNAQIVFDKENVFASFDDGTIAAYSLASGNLVWSFQAYLLDSEIFFVKMGDLIVTAAKDGRIFALEASSGKLLWYSRTNLNITDLGLTADNILVLTEKSKIGHVESFYSVDANAGSLNRIESFLKIKNTAIQNSDLKLGLSKDQRILKQPVISEDYLAVMLRLGGLRLYKIIN